MELPHFCSTKLPLVE